MWSRILSAQHFLRRVSLVFMISVSGAASASAGTLTVIGDVNVGTVSNQPFFDNILGDATSISLSRRRGHIGTVVDYIGSRPGAILRTNGGAITASSLIGVDLLIMTTLYNSAMDFSASEFDVVETFLEGAGNVLVLAEAVNSWTVTGYNSLLSGVGSSIVFTGQRVAENTAVTTFPAVAATQGLSQFSLNGYNTLRGGEGIISTAFGTVVAQQELTPLAPPETPIPATVPLPSSFWLLGGVLVLLKRRWKRTFRN